MTEKEATEMYRREFIGIGVNGAYRMIAECEKIVAEYECSGILYSDYATRTESWDGRVWQSFRERVLRAAWVLLVSGVSEADMVRCLADAAKLADECRHEIGEAANVIAAAKNIGMSEEAMAKLIDRCGFAVRIGGVHGSQMLRALPDLMVWGNLADKVITGIPGEIARKVAGGMDTCAAVSEVKKEAISASYQMDAVPGETKGQYSFRRLIKNYILGRTNRRAG